MPDVRLDGLPDTERVRCLLDLAAISRLGARASSLVAEAKRTGSWKKVQDNMANMYIDVSQNPVRQPWQLGCKRSSV